MGASKEYFLKLSEEQYNQLEPSEMVYLNSLGMITKHIPNESDEEDEVVKKFNKIISNAYDERDKYLFKKRIK